VGRELERVGDREFLVLVDGGPSTSEFEKPLDRLDATPS
jgi:hypothetical protein